MHRKATQFAVAATNRSALSSEETRSQTRCGAVRTPAGDGEKVASTRERAAVVQREHAVASARSTATDDAAQTVGVVDDVPRSTHELAGNDRLTTAAGHRCPAFSCVAATRPVPSCARHRIAPHRTGHTTYTCRVMLRCQCPSVCDGSALAHYS